MSWLPTLYFFVALFGIATAIGKSHGGVIGRNLSLGMPILREMLACPPCIAFWITLPASLFLFSPSAPLVDEVWKSVAIDAFASFGFTWLVTLFWMKHAPDEF